MAADETPTKASNSGDTLVQCADGLTQDTFKICKEFLRPFKKNLRKLNLPKDFPKEKRLSFIQKNLTVLGDHINVFLQHYCKKWEIHHWKKMLWKFVSLFSAFDEKWLCKMYRYSKTNQAGKFLRAFDCVERTALTVPSPDPGDVMRLHQKWRLQGDKKMQGRSNPGCLLSPSHRQPTGSAKKRRKGVERKRLSRSHTSRKEVLDSCCPLSKAPASLSLPRSHNLMVSVTPKEAFTED